MISKKIYLLALLFIGSIGLITTMHAVKYKPGLIYDPYAEYLTAIPLPYGQPTSVAKIKDMVEEKTKAPREQIVIKQLWYDKGTQLEAANNVWTNNPHILTDDDYVMDGNSIEIYIERSKN